MQEYPLPSPLGEGPGVRLYLYIAKLKARKCRKFHRNC